MARFLQESNHQPCCYHSWIFKYTTPPPNGLVHLKPLFISFYSILWSAIDLESKGSVTRGTLDFFWWNSAGMSWCWTVVHLERPWRAEGWATEYNVKDAKSRRSGGLSEAGLCLRWGEQEWLLEVLRLTGEKGLMRLQSAQWSLRLITVTPGQRNSWTPLPTICLRVMHHWLLFVLLIPLYRFAAK